MQVKTRSRNLVRHPRISFSTGGQTFCADLGDFPAEQSFRDISFFKIMSFAPGSSTGRMLLPPNNHIFGKIGSGIVWWKKGTPRKPSAALIFTEIMCSLVFLGYYCQECQASRTSPCTAEFPFCTVKFMFSWGTDPQKSAKAIAEIAFKMQ